MPALTAGQLIAARFRLLHSLVDGESPELWLALDAGGGDQVALAILPAGVSDDDLARLRALPASPEFDSHRHSGLAFITIACAGGESARRRAAAGLIRLREALCDHAGELPKGGDERPAGAAGSPSAKPRVSLTPPPRVQPIRPITPRFASDPGESAAPGRRRIGAPGLAAAGALIIAGLIVFLFRNDPPPGGTVGVPAVAQGQADAPAAGDGVIPAPAPPAGSPSGGAVPLDDQRRRAYLKDRAEEAARRAEVLDELNDLLDEGARQERAGDAAGAKRTYARAAALDPLSEEAREALARMETRLGDDLFAAAISDGLAALARDEFEAARAAFRRAAGIRPQSKQATDGLLQAEEGEKLASITAHRDRAIAMEEEERWRVAEKEYDAILRLDPAIRIAAEGVERTRTRAELMEAIAYHLDHPDRLASDEVFEEASLLLARAAAVAPAGPLLRTRVEALDALLLRMRSVVRVVLESDERTDVTIYRVGRLGTFSRHEVELRPGTYTVVGTRRGYRDVRHRLVIAPGEEPDILVVRCEEKI